MLSDHYKSKPSLLLVANFLSDKGSSFSVGEELAEHLLLAGYQVITTSRLRSRLLRYLDMVSTVWFRRKDYQSAYVEVYSGLSFFWAESVCWLFNKLGKPYILTLHGGNLPAFAQRHPVRVRRLLNSASLVTAPSKYLLTKIKPYCKELLLLPNPLHIPDYQFSLRENPRPVLIWLRAFHEIYNPSLAPRMITLLSRKFPSMHLKMVGPDKGDGSLQLAQNLSQNLGVAENIEFIGGIPKRQVPQYLNSADIFINTTNVDNMPVSVIEAMACGLCVVSTNVGGIPYLLDDENDALLVPADDPEAMARAIRRILTEPGLAARLSANARSKVEQFDWSVILPQWESLFAGLVRNA